MKKTFVAILLSGYIVGALAGCNDKKEETETKSDIYSCSATITECEGNSIFVVPI